MTTGRINQVTILQPPSPEAPRGRPERRRHPPKGTEVSCAPWLGRPRRARPTGRPHRPRERVAVDLIGHPIAPTEFPKGWSAAKLAQSPEGPYTRLWHAPLKRRRPRDGHIQAEAWTVTDPGLPPEIL